MIVKICGITRIEDARHAAAHGATALGLVFWTRSPRCVPIERARRIVRALPAHVPAVGVFVNAPLEEVRAVAARTGIGIVQLHGDEPPAFAAALGLPAWRALAPGADAAAWPPEVTLLLDAADPVRRGGTGRTVDRAAAARLAAERAVILAGGLTPETVAGAVADVRPAGVDVSSGVETAPGIKDPERVAAFLAAAQAALHAHR